MARTCPGARNSHGWPGCTSRFLTAHLPCAAGHDGGQVVFEGTPRQLVEAASTLTGEHLAAYVGNPGPPLAPTPPVTPSCPFEVFGRMTSCGRIPRTGEGAKGGGKGRQTRRPTGSRMPTVLLGGAFGDVEAGGVVTGLADPPGLDGAQAGRRIERAGADGGALRAGLGAPEE